MIRYTLPNVTSVWRRPIGSLKLQIIFYKRATEYRSLLRKMTYRDKGSCESWPPCSQAYHSETDLRISCSWPCTGHDIYRWYKWYICRWYTSPTIHQLYVMYHLHMYHRRWYDDIYVDDTHHQLYQMSWVDRSILRVYSKSREIQAVECVTWRWCMSSRWFMSQYMTCRW